MGPEGPGEDYAERPYDMLYNENNNESAVSTVGPCVLKASVIGSSRLSLPRSRKVKIDVAHQQSKNQIL